MVDNPTCTMTIRPIRSFILWIRGSSTCYTKNLRSRLRYRLSLHEIYSKAVNTCWRGNGNWWRWTGPLRGWPVNTQWWVISNTRPVGEELSEQKRPAIRLITTQYLNPNMTCKPNTANYSTTNTTYRTHGPGHRSCGKTKWSHKIKQKLNTQICPTQPKSPTTYLGLPSQRPHAQ